MSKLIPIPEKYQAIIKAQGERIRQLQDEVNKLTSQLINKPQKGSAGRKKIECTYHPGSFYFRDSYCDQCYSEEKINHLE